MERGKPGQRRRIEPFLGGLALLALLVGCVFVLRPFLTALMWASVLSYSLHPLQRRFTIWFRGSRTWAACVVTLMLTLVIVGPVVLIGMSLAEDAKRFGLATREWVLAAPDEPPGWVAGMPVVGNELGGYWSSLAESRRGWIEQLDRRVERAAATRRQDTVEAGELPVENGDAPRLIALLGRTIAGARELLIGIGLAVGNGVLQVLLGGFLTFFLLRDSEELGSRLHAVVDRLAGGRGRHLVKVAGDTVNSVVYGILGTALVQSVLAGIGFAIAGVPGAVLLGVLTFFVAVVPFGPPLVWVPAGLWLIFQGSIGWGIFVLIWGAVCVSSVDNIIRPYLISQGSKMPFALIFCGVIGGAMAFGLVGVFLGPTLLAVAFRLIEEWSAMPPAEV